jgi:L-ascorbate metabolism protein UlaG (beta-lactamase superfamily)
MNINFKWFGGGSWMLTAENIKIICDPVLCPVGSLHDYRFFKSTRISPPRFTDSDLDKVDLWLFTHGHKDHCDFGGLRPIGPEGIVISDESALQALKKESYDASILLAWGKRAPFVFHDDSIITIEAIPAIHGLSARKGKLVGNGNGYWIDILHGKKTVSIYSTGDTLPNDQTIRAIRGRPCDLFIANVGAAAAGKGILSKIIGRITMTMADAASLGKSLHVKTTVPIHWDAFEHYRERDVFELCERYKFRYMKQGESIQIK